MFLSLFLAGISFAGVNINEPAPGNYITGSSFLHLIMTAGFGK